MPKLKNQLPKMCKLGDYAVVYVRGKRVYLGTYGSQEAKIGYARILAELANPALCPPKGEKDITVKELTAAFLDHAKATLHKSNYAHYRTLVLGFLDKLYGDNTYVNNFTPGCLKLVRGALVNARNKKGNDCRIFSVKAIMSKEKITNCPRTWNIQNNHRQLKN